MSQDCYRDCASILVFRPTDVCAPDGCTTLYQILLLHKPRKNDAWQLPQGGVEAGETAPVAALRELKEEAGISAKLMGTSEKTYKYDFPPSFRRFRPDNVCGQNIHFVFAELEPDQKVQVDGKEIDGHVWILPEQLGFYLSRKEYLEFVKQLINDGQQLLQK